MLTNMNYAQLYLDVFRKHYADFQGRARRSEYWTFATVNFLIILLISGLMAVVDPAVMQTESRDLNTGGNIVIGLFGLFVLVNIVPSIAITIRRLHDSGRTGWFYLFHLIPYLGSFIIMIFALFPSEPRANKWGPYHGLSQEGARQNAGEYADW